MFIESVDRIIPHEFDVFVGLDVDARNYHVTVLNWAGTVHQFTMSAQPKGLVSWRQQHLPQARVAWVYEAGPTGYGVYDALSQSGDVCLVTPPALLPRVPGRRVKTNRLDSLELAIRLRGGELTGLRVPTPRIRSLRHLTHQWLSLAQRVRGVKCQIKSLLLMEGRSLPEVGRGWSRAVGVALAALACDAEVQFVLQQRWRQLTVLHEEQLRLGRRIRAYCRADPDLAESLSYLMSLPGIGWVTGAHILARVGEWRRLKRPQELAKFAGLNPWEHSTGLRIVRGGISRSGDRHLRNLLIEAAWRATRVDPELRAFYERLRRRNPREQGARKAIVAVARKLTERIGRVLMDRRCYRPVAQRVEPRLLRQAPAPA
jgi:transposase